MLGFHSMSNFSASLCGRQHSTQVPLCSTANVSLGMSELGVCETSSAVPRGPVG